MVGYAVRVRVRVTVTVTALVGCDVVPMLGLTVCLW